MSDYAELSELAMYLVRTTRLSEAEARKVIDEVLAFMNETPEDFIRRRHLSLQAQGYSNADIFTQVARDLHERRFRAPELSERQIRRIIYG